MGEDRGILGSIFQYFGNCNYIYIYNLKHFFFQLNVTIRKFVKY